jgi:hypothetical protein
MIESIMRDEHFKIESIKIDEDVSIVVGGTSTGDLATNIAHCLRELTKKKSSIYTFALR